jgi:hypothetical protein
VLSCRSRRLLLAGHQARAPRELREELSLHVGTVRNLIPVNEALLFRRRTPRQRKEGHT